MLINPSTGLSSKFPQPPQPTLDYETFPNDLIIESNNGGKNRNFFTQIEFIKYSDVSWSGGSTGIATPNGGIVLPIPKKLNDVQTVIWEEASLTGMAMASAQQLALGGFGGGWGNFLTGFAWIRGIAQAAGMGAAAASIASGLTLNPALYMMFKSPSFKEHTLSWTLSPNTEQESQTLANIIFYFKHNMLPSKAAGGILYRYPSIAVVKLYPDDFFTFKFLPCAVTAVQVDHTGAGGPSFFKNGAPTTVNLTVQLKEIDLWTKESVFANR